MESKNYEKSSEVFIYLCGILDEKTKAERGLEADSPAATKKVLDVTKALGLGINNTYVVSMGRGKQNEGRSSHKVKVCKLKGIPTIYAQYSPIPFYTYVLSALSLIKIVFGLYKKASGEKVHIIAYNRQSLYLPALIVARLLSIKCYLDLEDAQLIGKSNKFVTLLKKLYSNFFDSVCQHGAILVSPTLMNRVKIHKKTICYGVAEKKKAPSSNRHGNGLINIHFGGSLLRETGVDLLIAAVAVLENDYPELKNKLKIHITGYGEKSLELQALSEGDYRDWVAFHGRVSQDKYHSILNDAHVALCLKLPSSEMGITTFPSKVLEIASHGKLLLTTKLPQVQELFGDSGAYYIEEAGIDLAKSIAYIVNNPKNALAKAINGQSMLVDKCSSYNVAKSIIELFKSTS
jgi:glycosyltransferase involved in cell wall biosynthesis